MLKRKTYEKFIGSNDIWIRFDIYLIAIECLVDESVLKMHACFCYICWTLNNWSRSTDKRNEDMNIHHTTSSYRMIYHHNSQFQFQFQFQFQSHIQQPNTKYSTIPQYHSGEKEPVCFDRLHFFYLFKAYDKHRISRGLSALFSRVSRNITFTCSK